MRGHNAARQGNSILTVILAALFSPCRLPRGGSASECRLTMNYSWKKIVSSLVAVALITWAGFAAGALPAIQMAVFQAIGLMVIWNSDDLGSSTMAGFITSPTPIWLVNIGGWIVQLFPVFIIWRALHH
jgi:hypothetical protein